MYCFFFFKQKTAYEMRISDWSSDVCSSDLSMVLSVACTYFSLSGETSGNPKKVLASSAVQSKLIVTFMPLLLKDRRGDVDDHLVLHAATLASAPVFRYASSLGS